MAKKNEIQPLPVEQPMKREEKILSLLEAAKAECEACSIERRKNGISTIRIDGIKRMLNEHIKIIRPLL